MNLRELEKARSSIEELLTGQLVGDPFQYPTEKDLYDYGMRHRGILDRIERVRSKVGRIVNVLDDGNAALNHRYQFRIGLAAMIIAIIQSYSVIHELVGGKAESNPRAVIAVVIWMIMLVLGSFVIGRWYSQLGRGGDVRYERTRIRR